MKRRVPLVLQLTVILLALGITVHAQPAFVKTIPAGSENFTKINDFVFFTSGDSLLRTDGTNAGTILLKKGFDQFSHFTTLMESNGLLYFLSAPAPGYSDVWNELWRSDGTSTGTVRLNISSTQHDIRMIAHLGDYLYFTATDASVGNELYRTNGTPAGTTLVKDINPGAAGSGIDTAAVAGPFLLFGANDGVAGTELWRTNGLVGGTVMVEDISPGAASGFINGSVFGHNQKFYFFGNTPANGREPWVSDGTAEGTHLLKDTRGGAAGMESIDYEIALSDLVYFTATPPQLSETVMSSLWKTNGTSGTGTTFIENLPQCLENCQAEDAFHHFLTYKSKVYFFVNSTTEYDDLFVTDGSAGGTNSINQFRTNNGGITFFEVVNNHMLIYGVSDNLPHRLYRSDGTTIGTRSAVEFNANHFGIFPHDLTKVGNSHVYFGDHDVPTTHGAVNDPENHYQLTYTDGFGRYTLTGYGSFAGTDQIVDFNEKVLFSTLNDHPASNDRSRRLWLYDPAGPGSNSFTLVNADTDRRIQTIRDGDVVTKPLHTNINIQFHPEGDPGSVVFEHSNVVVRKENEPPFAIGGDRSGDFLPWQDAKPGNHRISATAYSGENGTGTPGTEYTINFTIEEEEAVSECTATGIVQREQWDNVQGNRVSDIPLHTPPTSTMDLTSLQAPRNIGTNYGARIRGYLCIPVTGDYTFFIASNDHSSFFLGTESPPSASVLVNVAYVLGSTDPEQWDKYHTQRSKPIRLTGGKQYYFEVRHKQGIGTDHVTVGWQLPDGTLERPIQGNRLSPYTDGNIPSDVAITSPADGAIYNAPTTVAINAYASDPDADIEKVEFFANTDKIGEDLSAPYSVNWSVTEPANYALTAVAIDDKGGSTTSQPVNVTVTGNCAATGTITREVWSGVQGSKVSDIPVDEPPTSTGELTMLEGPSNVGTNYGARIRGYICAPVTGEYVFYLSSNDQSELWLGTSDDPSSKRKIAYLTKAVGERQWATNYVSQVGIAHLIQGQKYYIEVLHKQGVGTDHIAVAWEIPGGDFEGPIPGSRLSPFMDASTSAANARVSQPDARFEAINIFPNPAQSGDPELTIAGYDRIEETVATTVEIFNMTGDVVFSETISCGGDCSSYLMKLNKQLVPGLYMVKMRSKNASLSRRLVVK